MGVGTEDGLCFDLADLARLIPNPSITLIFRGFTGPRKVLVNQNYMLYKNGDQSDYCCDQKRICWLLLLYTTLLTRILDINYTDQMGKA